jgi:serine protease Do
LFEKFKRDKNQITIFIIVALFSATIGGVIGGSIGTRLAAPPQIEISNKSGKSTYIADKITPSVVTIRARRPIQGFSKQMQQRIGCGVIFNPEGFIITNYHLVSEAKEIFVRVFRREEVTAKIVGSSKENDLAVLKVDLPHLSAPKFGSSKRLKLGETVIAIGKPFLISENYTVTSGVISALPIDLPKGSPTLFQTDAAINPGNSGGPLVNTKGEVIGITTAYLSTGENAPGIGFAIPFDLARKVVQEIISEGS